MTTTQIKQGHAPVNGLEMYYEIHGAGEPLLILHGGIGATEQFGPNLELWAKSHQVIVAHMQGHGFTRDIDRPYSYVQFADDTAALLDHLGIAQADVLGYSLGGGIAIRLAIQHPAKVRKLISIGASIARDQQYSEVIDAFPAMVANAEQMGAGMSQSPLAATYPDVNWVTAFRKMGELESVERDWSAEFAGLKTPTLLMFADADCYRPEHIVAMYQALGGFLRDASYDGSLRPEAQLAIVPGRTHYNILETTVAGEIVERYLAG